MRETLIVSSRGQITLPANMRKRLGIATGSAVIIEQRDWPIDQMFDLQEPITGAILTSQDAREGAAAFAERRAPVWKGQ